MILMLSQKDRSMYLYVSETHTRWGEAFGVVTWLWVFHRARQDLPVMYGFRHPWEHGDDHGHGGGDHGGHSSHGGAKHHGSPLEELEKFNAKATIQAEVEDDDEDEDEDDEE
eukprot:scaffold2510_cov169-Amphora_coffeaeformis.AAC.19